MILNNKDLINIIKECVINIVSQLHPPKGGCLTLPR